MRRAVPSAQLAKTPLCGRAGTERRHGKRQERRGSRTAWHSPTASGSDDRQRAASGRSIQRYLARARRDAGSLDLLDGVGTCRGPAKGRPRQAVVAADARRPRRRDARWGNSTAAQDPGEGPAAAFGRPDVEREPAARRGAPRLVGGRARPAHGLAALAWSARDGRGLGSRAEREPLGLRGRSYVLASSGYIAGIINPPGGKGTYWTNEIDPAPATAEHWRQTAARHDGSWWTDWTAWLAERSGKRVMPPPMGSAAHPPLGDAPGTYVLER